MPYTYTIVQFTVSNDLKIFGNDVIYFELVLQQGESYFETKISYRKMCKYLKEFHPEIAKYLDGVRNNITGFGPKETKVWSMLQEEDFDILPYLQDYIENNNEYLQPVDELPKRITDEERKALQKKVAQLDEHVESMKESNLKDIAFKDMLMEKLSGYVLEYYPEIFESDAKYIKELKGILVSNILSLGNDLEELSYKAFKEGE